MRIRPRLLPLSALVTVSFVAGPFAMQATKDVKATREIKVISSAGARALADACTAWAEQNKQVVAMAVLDWGGNLIEFHAMEGAPHERHRHGAPEGEVGAALAPPDLGDQ